MQHLLNINHQVGKLGSGYIASIGCLTMSQGIKPCVLCAKLSDLRGQTTSILE